MASKTENLSTTYAYVKGRAPLHGRPKTSVLAEIGNKLQNQTTEHVESRHPLKPMHIGNTENKPIITTKNVVELTETLKNISIIDTQCPTAENRLLDVEKLSHSSTLYNIQDIDKTVANDPSFVAEYGKDIFEYLRKLEVKYSVRQGFLCGTVTPRMRSILVDWLFDVQTQFSLLPETLFLTVAILDRYLQRVLVMEKKKIQLLGATSMFLASKYEETYPPEVKNFVYVCSNLYTEDDIKRMECHILKTLDFTLGYPLAIHFLRRYSQASYPHEVTYTLAKYFQELCLLEYDLCHHAPSRIAAAALYLALRLMNKNGKSDVWSETLIYYSNYKYKDIIGVVKKIALAIINMENTKLTALYEKYSRSKFLRVSHLPEVSTASVKKIVKLL